MAIESVKARVQALTNGMDADQLRALLTNLVDGIQAVCAKLDLDATVTDTNYAATFAAYVID